MVYNALFNTDDMQRKLEEMHKQCDKLRLENQAIKEVNDHLHAENSKLKTLSESIKDEGKVGILNKPPSPTVLSLSSDMAMLTIKFLETINR